MEPHRDSKIYTALKLHIPLIGKTKTIVHIL
jgi:hypothetical protein